MKLHHIDGYIQTILLAEYPEKLMLLDGCCRADVVVVENFITKQLQRPLTDLKLVVVTHMHPDHAGAATILRTLTGCKIATANIKGHWYHGVEGWLMHQTDMMLTKWVAKRKKQPKRNIWYSRKLTADLYLNSGDLIPQFEDWQAMFTPGHTDRDLSLHHLPTNVVYVADLIVMVKGQLTSPFPIFYPNRYRASLQKIKALKPHSIILAHGGEIHPSAKQYQELLDNAPTIPKTHWRAVKKKLAKTFID